MSALTIVVLSGLKVNRLQGRHATHTSTATGAFTKTQQNTVVIWDDCNSGINFTSPPTPALKCLYSEGQVIYIGNLSKTLAPDLPTEYPVARAALIGEARALWRLILRHPLLTTHSPLHFL